MSLSCPTRSRGCRAGVEVVVERGAGLAAGFPDEAYEDAGAALVDDAWGAELVVKVQKPSADEVERLAEGAALIAFLQPLTDREGVDRLAARGVIAFAMESIPRITRAQSMDALSSQATVAGYKAVVLAAERLPRFFPLLMTAAGTVAPAKVLVLGAGVAGLQAIATARRLGAVVSGFDTRPVVREQVESLGACFLDLGVRGEETAGGYATELTPEEQAAQQEALTRAIADCDVVVTTALVPGRPAPRLITAEAVRSMRPGSVVVDLAAEAGGNCELTEPGDEVVRAGVTILGPMNLPATMPTHASQLYSRNVAALVAHLAPEGELRLDWDDEITAGACVARPAVRPREPLCSTRRPVDESARNRHILGLRGRYPPPAPPPWVGGCVVGRWSAVRFGRVRKGPARVTTSLVLELTILVLAIFLGFEVISKVPTMLHTPLMSGTNAIHGIVLVGAIIVAGRADADGLTRVVGFLAVALAAANVVGGFVVTDRMLEMFKRRPAAPRDE